MLEVSPAVVVTATASERDSSDNAHVCALPTKKSCMWFWGDASLLCAVQTFTFHALELDLYNTRKPAASIRADFGRLHMA